MKYIFKGCATALITPMNENGIDYAALEMIIENQISAGIDALVLCGTTGESATLTDAERNEIIYVGKSVINGRVPLIVGTGSNNIEKAISNTKKAESLGADAALIVTPYYNKTTQCGLTEAYSAIARASDLPVIVYNVPSRTGMTIAPDTYSKLADIDKISAVKEASSDICAIAESIGKSGDKLAFYGGNDNMVLPLISLGAVGLISVASNIIPEAMCRICRLALSDDYANARKEFYEYLPLINMLFCETNPIPIKAAMEYLGCCGGKIRLPLIEMSSENRQKLIREINRLRGLNKLK